jgi:polyisoprenoid-binding protein YceI
VTLRARTVAVTLGLLALAGLGPSPRATGGEAPRAYVIDAARSELRFFAVSRFMNAAGAFSRFHGEVRLDETEPAAGSGRLTVEVASLDTQNGLRDRHLRGEDFFAVDRHPHATFATTRVRREDGSRWLVEGRFTLRGITRPLAVPVSVTPTAGGLRLSGELVLNRQDFGVSYQSFLNPIADEVRVRFALVAIPG